MQLFSEYLQTEQRLAYTCNGQIRNTHNAILNYSTVANYSKFF